MIDPLAVVRAIHFAAAAMVAGALAFSVLVADPAWQRSAGVTHSVPPHSSPVEPLTWLGLVVSLASAMAWLVLIAAEITGGSWTDAIGDGTAYAVLTDTQFGFILQSRLLLTVVLLALLVAFTRRQTGAGTALRIAAAVVGAGWLGSLAWTGHAGGASGSDANVHLFADILHLLAAGTWVGGLFPLAFLLAWFSRKADPHSFAACAQILKRFSNLGIVAVAALVASGVMNTWFLTAHMRGLIGTPYGQLLQIKIGLFLAMLCIAADNRLRLLPRIAQAEDQRSARALRQLRRNTILEIALGVVIIYVVGVLGLTPPAGHVHGAESACHVLDGSHRVASGRCERVLVRSPAKTVCASGSTCGGYTRSMA